MSLKENSCPNALNTYLSGTHGTERYRCCCWELQESTGVGAKRWLVFSTLSDQTSVHFQLLDMLCLVCSECIYYSSLVMVKGLYQNP